MSANENRDEWYRHLNENARSSKNWTVAFCLSLFLGFFALDRFYLGYTGLSLLKFATAGGFGLWWIIDIVLLLSNRMRDGNDDFVKRPF